MMPFFPVLDFNLMLTEIDQITVNGTKDCVILQIVTIKPLS